MSGVASGRRIVRCSGVGCGMSRIFEHGVPVPDGGAFCVSCEKRAEARIALSLLRLTGRPSGGITLIDGRLVARQIPE